MSGSSSDDFVLLCCWKGASCVTNVLIFVCEIKDKCNMVTMSPDSTALMSNCVHSVSKKKKKRVNLKVHYVRILVLNKPNL